MSRSSRIPIGAVLLLALSCVSLSLPAAPPVGMDEAAAMVKLQYGGKVISAEEFGSPAGSRYRFKVLQPSGRLKTVVVDAGSGAEVDEGADKGKGNKD